MFVVDVRNVHDALPEGLRTIDIYAERRESRNGDVMVMPGPTTTVYRRPTERVLFHPERDANPFFHFFEGLWMLAGRNDVEFLTRYVKRMATFSDDGETLHGAYGHRWRQHFGFDQLGHVMAALCKNPDDRRNVVQMWDATVDLGRVGKDLPCNTQIYFTRDSSGALDMTVCCRSNDLIWGTTGANAVHFSMLQEYMAAGMGCKVGVYYQMSNNYHAYVDTYEPLKCLIGKTDDGCREITGNPYTDGSVEPWKMINTPIEEWQQDLQMFLDEGMVVGIRDPFFRKVAQPIRAAHWAYKNIEGMARFDKAAEALEKCAATDWWLGCQQWLDRRFNAARKAQQAQNNGEQT